MDSTPQRDSRVLWYFWVACGLAATGAIAPVLLGTGGPSRLAGGAIPFGIAAAAMAANALSYPGGRPLATGLYILTWLAIVYGILRMVAIPLQALVGSCTSDVCTPGLAAFSGGAGFAIGIGLVTGALALQVGLFGMRIIYRSSHNLSPAVRVSANAPPIRRAHLAVSSPAETTPAAPDPALAAPLERPASVSNAASSALTSEQAAPSTAPSAAGAPRARKPRTKRPPKPAAELQPPPEPAELPPHAEPAELPAHSPSDDDSGTTSQG
jgi:hypothetical protein